MITSIYNVDYMMTTTKNDQTVEVDNDDNDDYNTGAGDALSPRYTCKIYSHFLL